MSAINLRPIQTSDYQIVLEKIIDSWESEIIVVHGTIFHPAELPGFGFLLKSR